MNLLDMQILFQQKIEDINPVFREQDRPDTFVIENYLNKAINQYIEKKYISLPSFEHRLIAIDNNLDELQGLIESSYTLLHERSLTDFNWGTRGKRYRAPDNILIPISLSCTVTRTEIYPMTGQKVFAQFVSRRQAEKLVSNPADKVMYPYPVALWEDPYYMIVISDAYTTSLSAGPLSYLRKPFTLSHSYTELSATGVGNLSLPSVGNLAVGGYFLLKSYSTYVNDAGEATTYPAGSKVKRIATYNTVYNYGGSGEQVVLGYPWGYTDTPDFPSFIHDRFVEMAVSLFMDEAKLKLISKAQ